MKDLLHIKRLISRWRGCMKNNRNNILASIIEKSLSSRECNFKKSQITISALLPLKDSL